MEVGSTLCSSLPYSPFTSHQELFFFFFFFLQFSIGLQWSWVMSVLFARRPPQRALLHLNKEPTSCCFQCRCEEPWPCWGRAALFSCKRRADRFWTYTGCLVWSPAWWGMLGSAQYAKGWGGPGKRAAALQNHKALFLGENSPGQPAVLQTWGWEEERLPLPLPGSSKVAQSAAGCEEPMGMVPC